MKTCLDFETYSEAGYHRVNGKWRPLIKGKSGLEIVGTYSYAAHPSTRILCAAYEIGGEMRLWVPGMWPPDELIQHAVNGGSIRAWNTFFEFCIWNFVACKAWGCRPLKLEQMFDTMADSRRYGLPGKLEKAGAALNAPDQKLESGTRLIKKFSIPH